jgi:hypothetical protein
MFKELISIVNGRLVTSSKANALIRSWRKTVMFDQYVKLFNISWIEPWMVEALAMIAGALILAFVICKAMECLNGDRS